MRIILLLWMMARVQALEKLVAVSLEPAIRGSPQIARTIVEQPPLPSPSALSEVEIGWDPKDSQTTGAKTSKQTDPIKVDVALQITIAVRLH